MQVVQKRKGLIHETTYSCLYLLSCISYLVSLILCLLSCVSYLVSLILCLLSCITYLISLILYLFTCISYLVSLILNLASPIHLFLVQKLGISSEEYLPVIGVPVVVHKLRGTQTQLKRYMLVNWLVNPVIEIHLEGQD